MKGPPPLMLSLFVLALWCVLPLVGILAIECWLENRNLNRVVQDSLEVGRR